MSSLDRPHSLTLGWVYELPFGKGKRWFGENRLTSALLGGFQLNGLFAASSGVPFTIVQGKTNLILSTQRPDVVDPSNLSGKAENRVFEGPARRWLIEPGTAGFPFTPSGQLAIGNLGRNTGRAPGFCNFNLGVFRAFRLTEKARFEIRAEAYNALNHVNWHRPGSVDIDNANFGLITDAAPARQMQIGARIAW